MTVRLPIPPTVISAPAPAEAFLGKFNAMIAFNQNLISALEIKELQNSNQILTSNQDTEDRATAVGFFLG
jgi:hypothetical protein|tara:strand:+ start:159 stop:368 length:210 start_codon:yes stop_codon:yes gene_type:complete